MISGNRVFKPEAVAKLRGYKNQMLRYKFLASLHICETLQVTVHLAYVMQTKSSIVTDIMETLVRTKNKITEKQTEKQTNEEIDLLFPVAEEPDDDSDPDSVYIDAEATNLPSMMLFKNKNQLIRNS